MRSCRIFLIACCILAAHATVRADEPTPFEAAMAGGTIKTLARAFIATMNLDDVKSNAVEKLNRMGPEHYRWQYGQYYKVIKDLPPRLKRRYGVVEDMPKAQLVRNILSLDKKQFYEIVEAIPDATIAREIKNDARSGGAGAKGKDFMGQIQAVWQEIAGDMTRKPPVLGPKAE
jgi:hypothetical protein